MDNTFNESINKIMNESHDLGVEHAIVIIQRELGDLPANLLNPIIKELEGIKKVKPVDDIPDKLFQS